MTIQRKVCDSEVKEYDEKDLTVVHFISTERRDRGGDVLLSDGMRVTGKPVVLLQHGWGVAGSEPIAKPVWIKKGEFKNRKGVQAKTQFYPDELGKRLWDKCAHGYIPNWSIGWLPLKEEFVTEKDGGRTRLVSEWELLEYSLVGVPMQPDAQNVDKTGDILFKVLDGCTNMEEKLGELYLKMDDGQIVDLEEKPFPNEHACRLEDPDKYIRFRRANDKFGKGIHAIWGVQGGDKPVELQAIRFGKEKFTVPEARAWLKEHEYKCILFEPASEKCETCGKVMAIVWDQDVSGEKCGMTCEAMFEHHCEDPKCVEPSPDSDPLKEILGISDEVREYIHQFVQDHSLTMTDELIKMKKQIDDLSVMVSALSEAEKKRAKEAERQPSEPKTVTIVNTEEQRKEVSKQITDALSNTIGKVIKETVKEEFDRLRGKVK